MVAVGGDLLCTRIKMGPGNKALLGGGVGGYSGWA